MLITYKTASNLSESKEANIDVVVIFLFIVLNTSSHCLVQFQTSYRFQIDRQIGHEPRQILDQATESLFAVNVCGRWHFQDGLDFVIICLNAFCALFGLMFLSVYRCSLCSGIKLETYVAVIDLHHRCDSLLYLVTIHSKC